MMKNTVEVRIGTIDDAFNQFKGNIEKTTQKTSNGIVYIMPADVPKVLSAERLRLIQEMRKDKYTITQLADKLHRKREHVSHDLAVLEDAGLVQIERNGREAHPHTPKKIAFTI
jgi:predicted transcriptional regulator